MEIKQHATEQPIFFLKKTDKLLTKVTKKKEVSSKQKYK